MDKDKVEKLAKLSRIDLTPEEALSLSQELGSVLDYVSEIKEAGLAARGDTQDKSAYALRNVMREDATPHESGIYTNEILEQVPEREGDYIKVKKIL
jgi:aspartyl/glutamyl-tRNA(Asn/Gln) amidotransferase C subunit